MFVVPEPILHRSHVGVRYRMANLYTLQDPTKQYVEAEVQAVSLNLSPGLAKKMDPRPDHGEESYIGHGRLPNRKALVTGGDSGIGRAAAIAYAAGERADAAASAIYLAKSPTPEKCISLIEKEGRKAVAIPGDCRSESFCQKLAIRN